MNTTRRITLEFLLLSALTFMLSLGHIVIANVYDIPCLECLLVLTYCTCCWLSHRCCGMHKVNCGFACTVLVCILTFFLVDRILFKEEKGCRDLVISIIGAMRQAEINGNEESEGTR